MPTCKLEGYFDAKGIKKHIQDCLKERRRQVTNGHDYEKVWLTMVYCKAFTQIILVASGKEFQAKLGEKKKQQEKKRYNDAHSTSKQSTILDMLFSFGADDSEDGTGLYK